MKLKFMNKMIAIMCAATVATSGVVTSVGAVGETKAIQQIMDNITRLEQKKAKLKKENSNDKIEQLNKEIEKSTKSIKAPGTNIQGIRTEWIDIEKLNQARVKENKKINERKDKNKKALKDIDRQIKDAKKQVEFMEAFQELGNKISEFTRWNASKKAVVSYTDVIAKNIMARCLELKNNFQARRANAIIQQIKKSIEAMQQYRQKYELKHTNENNRENLVKEKNNETIKIKKTRIPVKVKKENNSVTGVRNKKQAITDGKHIDQNNQKKLVKEKNNETIKNSKRLGDKSYLYNNVKPKTHRGGWSLPESVKCIAKLARFINKTPNGSKMFWNGYSRNKGNYNNYNKLDTKTIKEKALSSCMALNNNPNQKNDNTNQDQIESPSGLDFSFRDGPVNNSGHFGGVDGGSENSSTSGESNFTLGCHALEDEKVEGKKGEAEGQYYDVNVFMSFGPISD